VRARLATRAGFARAGQGVVDHAFLRLGPAAHHGEVLLAHGAAHELLAQRGGDFAGTRDQQHAAGGAIQPMRQVDGAAKLFAQQIDQEFLGIADHLRSMHGQTRGLVHRDQASSW
jgi:hypothetical protein